MRIINMYDWKYEVAFDDTVYKEVKRYSLKLNAMEREIMEEEINFYRAHFSFQQVLDVLDSTRNSEDKQAFLKKVYKRTNDIYYMPVDLREYYTKLINTDYKDYKETLTILLDKALYQSKKNIFAPLYKSILGIYFGGAIKTLKRYAERVEQSVRTRSIGVEHVESEARIKLKALSVDTYLHRFWGRDYIRHNIPIAVEDREGTPQWNAKECSFSPNKLTICGKKMTEAKLDFDLATGVYPGKAHFYNTVLKDPSLDIKFDCGASFIINGWALFAGWHSKPSAYIRNTKKEYSIIQLSLLNKNLEKAYKEVYVYLLNKYDKKSVNKTMVQLTQYPGLFESYVLGALATESTIDEGFANNPEHYLTTISEINMGDFFRIYTPKMQKKIKNTSITARVAKNFR